MSFSSPCKTFAFQTEAPLATLKTLAEQTVPSFTWSLHESDFEGTYLLGRKETGEKIKVLTQNNPHELECWGTNTEEQAPLLFTAWNAQNIKEIA